MHRSFDIAAFFLDISHDISEEDVIRILDAGYALRHIESRMENRPSAILALVYPGSKKFRIVETMEQDLLSYHEDLIWKSDFADVAPERLPRLNCKCLRLLIEIAAFCDEASSSLQTNLPAADARKLTIALYQFFKTVFHHVKLTEDLETQKIKKPGQERKQLEARASRENVRLQKRALQKGEQILRLLEGCPKKLFAIAIRIKVTRIVKDFRDHLRNS